MDHHAIGAQLQTAESLRAVGVTRTMVAAAVRDGRLHVVRRGAYVDREVWAGWHTEERELARTFATMRCLRGSDVAASHTSALPLFDLPLVRCRPQRAHVTGPTCDGSIRGGVARHRGAIAGDLVEVDGIAVTSLTRTVADVIGRLPIVAAVAVADAALRRAAWDRSRTEPYDSVAAAAFVAASREHLALQPGARGSVQARWVLDFADGRAQLPGESTTRFFLHLLGYAPPRLQVPVVVGPRRHEVDFSLDDVDTWLEFDGRGKYVDAALRDGRSTAEVLLAEKRREDDIRGATRRGFIRVEGEHIAGVDTLRRRLAEYGLHAPGAPGRAPRPLRSSAL